MSETQELIKTQKGFFHHHCAQESVHVFVDGHLQVEDGFFYMLKAPNLPLVLNILIDHPSNAHSHDSIVPRGDEHQSQTHAHAQEGQGPVGATGPRLDLCTYEYEQNNLVTAGTEGSHKYH